jgi:hypothetical protein
MELKAHELSGYSVSSNVLLADAAFGLEKFLMTLFAKALAWFEEYAFLQGNRRPDSRKVAQHLTLYALRVLWRLLVSAAVRHFLGLSGLLAPDWLPLWRRVVGLLWE